MSNPPNDHIQTVDTTPVQLMTAMQEVSARLDGVNLTIRAQNEMLASHIRSNLETARMIQVTLESQLRYRAIREEMDESRLQKEIEQKSLEVGFLGKKVDELLEENQEADAIRLQYAQAKLEIEKLKMQIEILQTAKRSTSENLRTPVKAEKSLRDRAWDGMILTAVSVTTGAVLTGIFAFIWFLVRLYITGATP